MRGGILQSIAATLAAAPGHELFIPDWVQCPRDHLRVSLLVAQAAQRGQRAGEGEQRRVRETIITEIV